MDVPIACTLTSREQVARGADLSALAARALRWRERTDRGERLTFDGSEQTERDLRAAVAAEASCCAFLTMDLRRRDDALLLDVAGPEEARPIIAELFA